MWQTLHLASPANFLKSSLSLESTYAFTHVSLNSLMANAFGEASDAVKPTAR
jgi:hypothetical protein